MICLIKKAFFLPKVAKYLRSFHPPAGGISFLPSNLTDDLQFSLKYRPDAPGNADCKAEISKAPSSSNSTSTDSTCTQRT